VADKEEQEKQVVGEMESPADFLRNLSNALRAREGVDVGVADILAKHLLSGVPAADGVAKARDLIISSRANGRH